MAVTIKNITFNKVPKKKAKGLGVSMELTQTGIPQDVTVAQYLQSENFYKLIHALDINWDGISIGNGVEINDTSDLINWILDLSNQNEVSIGQNSNWFIGGVDTGVSAAGIQGPKGDDGLTTKIVIGQNEYTQQDGTITLPDYPSSITKEELDDLLFQIRSITYKDQNNQSFIWTDFGSTRGDSTGQSSGSVRSNCLVVNVNDTQLSNNIISKFSLHWHGQIIPFISGQDNFIQTSTIESNIDSYYPATLWFDGAQFGGEVYISF